MDAFIYKNMTLLPMFVPTITYGFILMYLFGNEGILSNILSELPFTIYGKMDCLLVILFIHCPPLILLFLMRLIILIIDFIIFHH